jgi:hypothetical protein
MNYVRFCLRLRTLRRAGFRPVVDRVHGRADIRLRRPQAVSSEPDPCLIIALCLHDCGLDSGEEDSRDATEVLGIDTACGTLQSIDVPQYIADAADENLQGDPTDAYVLQIRRHLLYFAGLDEADLWPS